MFFYAFEHTFGVFLCVVEEHRDKNCKAVWLER